MSNILAFDSLYILSPLRRVYLLIIKKLLNKNTYSKKVLILYRLDKENIFLRDKRNLSGIQINVHTDEIDALSIKFYNYLNKKNACKELKIKKHKLYDLYTRQIKLKLIGLIRCAYRIRKICNDAEGDLEIISDRQTISMMKETLLFLNFMPSSIHWKSTFSLTFCISINSLLMRLASLIKMLVESSDLPKEYYYKHVNSQAPSILITMPKRRPEDFYESYVKKFGKKLNIFIYSVGHLKNNPKKYQRLFVKRKIGILRGLLKLNYLFLNSQSYIADILIIFKSHSNLSISIDIVNSIYSHNIDAHINRQQTNVLENLLAREAKKRRIFIYGDIMEEIFFCNFCVCPSESEFTQSVKMALEDTNQVKFRGSNSLIKYRLSNFTTAQGQYLHKLLQIDDSKKIIFYASDPSKEETQRYLSERFLFKYFKKKSGYILILKTHSQDNGAITFNAYKDEDQPSNVILIGDKAQKNKIISKKFKIFDQFDFNSAIAKCNGFLTSSSTSILEAVAIGKKSGILDLFNNGNFHYLVKYNAISFINDRQSLEDFLHKNKTVIDDNILNYCGLKNDDKFHLENHFNQTLKRFRNYN